MQPPKSLEDRVMAKIKADGPCNADHIASRIRIHQGKVVTRRRIKTALARLKKTGYIKVWENRETGGRPSTMCAVVD